MGSTATVQQRLDRFTKGTRYAGLAWESGGAPIAATTGTALVVVGAASLADAVAILRETQPAKRDGLPAGREAARILAAAARDTPATAEVVRVGPTTQPLGPDAATVAAARAALDVAIVRCDRTQEALRAAGRGASIATRNAARDARLEAAGARSRLAAAERGPLAHALAVGPAWVDLRLVRASLAALGCRVGALRATGGDCDAVEILCEGGAGVVMPLRR